MIRRCFTLPKILFSRTTTHLKPLTRSFSNKRTEEEQKILDEMEASKKQEEEHKTMPGLFYGAAGLLVFMMFYLNYIIKTPKSTEQKKPTVKVIGEAKIGGPWTMLDSQGNLVSDTDFRDKYVVYYFGFTRCPDVCPASLTKLASAIDILKQRGINNVEFLFVSLDPEKDTPEKVGKYAGVFHEGIRGLLVPQEDLPVFLKNFKLYSRKVYEGEEYMLDHTTYMYLFDKNGKFVNVLGANLNFEELADTIQEHMQEIEKTNK